MTDRWAFLVALGLAMGCASAKPAPQAPDNPWSRQQFPSRGASLSIGSYAAGCLEGGVSPPPDGKGYQMMRLARHRFYGHPTLIRYIEQLGAKVDGAGLGALLIGDLSQPRGGPSLSGHRSHQNGLDIDIWYWLQKPILTLDEREALSAPSMVVETGIAGAPFVHPDLWNRKHAEVLRLAASFGEVERVFVSASIKRELCAHPLEGDRSWMRKIRPWFGHVDHFHVRLRCPADSSDACVSQESIPAGDGCDSTLDWWFSKEALEKNAGEEAAPVELPKLPDRCASLLD